MQNPHRHLLSAALLTLATASPVLAEIHVIHISVDGLGGIYPQPLIDAHQLPNFQRLQTQGAWTNNARTDFDYTITLPNHTSQLTGYPVTGTNGHNWTINVDPAPGQTLHNNPAHNNAYLPSIFDVAHDHGLSTAMIVGKSKFSLYDTSYDAAHGAPDLTGPNNGTDKIDLYANVGESPAVVAAFLSTALTTPTQFTFLHFADPDNAGHANGWGSPAYNASLTQVDSALGTLLNFITSSPSWKDQTYIVLTADHGGGDPLFSHDVATSPLDYTIPFYVWGPQVSPGTDLYALNPLSRANPGTSRPDFTSPLQPIRNGDAANLELQLLGLPAVPGSTINPLQNLAVPEPATLPLLTLTLALLQKITPRPKRQK